MNSSYGHTNGFFVCVFHLLTPGCCFLLKNVDVVVAEGIFLVYVFLPLLCLLLRPNFFVQFELLKRISPFPFSLFQLSKLVWYAPAKEKRKRKKILRLRTHTLAILWLLSASCIFQNCVCNAHFEKSFVVMHTVIQYGAKLRRCKTIG